MEGQRPDTHESCWYGTILMVAVGFTLGVPLGVLAALARYGGGLTL